MLKCSLCQQVKPENCFSILRTSTRGRHSHCKVCRNKAADVKRKLPQHHLGRPSVGDRVSLLSMQVCGKVTDVQTSLKQNTEIAFWIWVDNKGPYLCDNSPHAEDSSKWEYDN